MSFFLSSFFIYIQIEYKSISEAQRLFNLGSLAGIVDIGTNFSRELLEKLEHW